MADNNIINDGWIHLNDKGGIDANTNYMKVAVEKIEWDWMFKPTIEHLPSESHYYFDLKERFLVWKIKNLLFDTLEKAENFLYYIESWHDNATMELEVSYDGTNYVACGGGIVGSRTTNWDVCIAPPGPSKITKLSPGRGTVYQVGSLKLEEV